MIEVRNLDNRLVGILNKECTTFIQKNKDCITTVTVNKDGTLKITHKPLKKTA